MEMSEFDVTQIRDGNDETARLVESSLFVVLVDNINSSLLM